MILSMAKAVAKRSVCCKKRRISSPRFENVLVGFQGVALRLTQANHGLPRSSKFIHIAALHESSSMTAMLLSSTSLALSIWI